MRRALALVAVAHVMISAVHAQQSLQIHNTAANPFGYMRVSDAPGLEPAQLTLEAWITPQGIGVAGTTDAFGAVIAGKSLEGAVGTFLMPYGLSWSAGTSEVLGFVRTGANQGALSISQRTVSIGTTAHVAMTYDGTFVHLFLNGILEGCASTGGLPVTYGTEDFLVGAGNFRSGFLRRFDGLIDEVRLWDRALSPTEILSRSGSPLTGSEPGLVGYWSFNSGTFIDDSGNGHDGMPEGTEWSLVPELTPTTPSGSPVGSNYCSPAVNNSTGVPGTIAAIGSTSLADDTLILMAQSLPPGQFGYFLAGRTQGSFSPPASSGTICLAGNIGRFNHVDSIGQGPCFSLDVDLGSFPVNPPTPPQAGESWNFQCWYRDGATNNFTDALNLTFH